jgi:hypothetical protein
VRYDKMVPLKGGRLWSWNGSHDLKRLVMIFICFILLFFGTSTKDPISRLVLSLFLLLPPVFSRLDVFYGSSID